MTDKTPAAELIAELKEADQERVDAILATENGYPEAEQRRTVLDAAQARHEALAVPGEPVTNGTPSGLWAKLLDGDGEEVYMDGRLVEADITPESVKPEPEPAPV